MSLWSEYLITVQKNSLFSLDERVSMIKEMTDSMPNVTVTSFNGLLVDYMREIDATIIVKRTARCNRF